MVSFCCLCASFPVFFLCFVLCFRFCFSGRRQVCGGSASGAVLLPFLRFCFAVVIVLVDVVAICCESSGAAGGCAVGVFGASLLGIGLVVVVELLVGFYCSDGGFSVLWLLVAGSVLAAGVVVGGGDGWWFLFFVLCVTLVPNLVWWWVEVLRWWVVVFGLCFAAGGVGVGGAAGLFWLRWWF
ncbi:hypothetical protein QL285_087884 [Trifolium repens]|nr:hypothetical protein QL285_087884 [Trifolium repens]